MTRGPIVRVDAASIAQALQGRRLNSHWLCRCPVPAHGQGKGDRNPSLSIRDGDKHLLVRCFAGCDARDVLDELRRRGLLTDGISCGSSVVDGQQKAWPDSMIHHEPDERALALWRSAETAAGSIVETYLQARHLHVRPPLSLRSIPEYSEHGLLVPAMIAGVQAPDGRIIAVQVTLLDPSGTCKADVPVPRKKTVGRLGLGAVRPALSSSDLGLAEGVEDALAAIQLTGIPTWACLGAGRMHRVEIPPSVKTLHVFADDDLPGREAADKTATRHAQEGGRVLIRRPPEGIKDWAEAAERASLNPLEEVA